MNLESVGALVAGAARVRRAAQSLSALGRMTSGDAGSRSAARTSMARFTRCGRGTSPSAIPSSIPPLFRRRTFAITKPQAPTRLRASRRGGGDKTRFDLRSSSCGRASTWTPLAARIAPRTIGRRSFERLGPPPPPVEATLPAFWATYFATAAIWALLRRPAKAGIPARRFAPASGPWPRSASAGRGSGRPSRWLLPRRACDSCRSSRRTPACRWQRRRRSS